MDSSPPSDQYLIVATAQLIAYSTAFDLQDDENSIDVRFEVLQVTPLVDAIDVWIEQSIDGGEWHETDRLSEIPVAVGDNGGITSSPLAGGLARFGLSVFSQASEGEVILGALVNLLRR